MKMLLIPLFLLVTSPAHAATKNEVSDLLGRIESEIRFYDQSERQLAGAKAALESVLLALRGGTDPEACSVYAVAKYSADGLGPEAAAEGAREWCGRVVERGASVDVLAFYVLKLRDEKITYAAALERALELGGELPLSQLDCVQRAYSSYREDGFSNTASLRKSAEFCRR